MENYNEEKISVILHLPEKLDYDESGFSRILDSILNQSVNVQDLIILNERNNNDFDIRSINTKIIQCDKDTTLSLNLNKAIEKCSGDYVVYIDNRTSEIILKNSFTETILLCIERNPDFGQIYFDYDLKEGNQLKEIHLLKHHIGRVRDNQDYGKVFVFSKVALQSIGNFDEKIKFNSLYDVRLKISEKHEIVHIANRYSGSLYTLVASAKKQNVFDYLLASKDSQLEAENVVTEHLKRIGAYLKPNSPLKNRPNSEAELVASIVIPVNNRPEFIESALSSIFDQTIKNIEAIIVVNGGEEDSTINEVKKYMEGGEFYNNDNPKVRLIVTDINNIGLCLNLGTKYSKGKYYIQLDSDDRLKPDAVEKAVNLFESDPSIGMAIGSYEVWEKKENGDYTRMEEIPVVTHDEWTEDNGRNNLLRINGAGAPRCIPFSVIKDIGYFSLNEEPYARNYGEDYDIVLRISEKYKIGRIYDPIYEVVRHAGGTDHAIDQSTVDRNDEAKDFMRKETIRRRIKLNKQ